MSSCDFILKDSKFHNMIVRNAFQYAMDLSRGKKSSDSSFVENDIVSIVFNPNAEITNIEYFYGRGLNKYREQCPCFLYYYKRYECNKSLLNQELSCPITDIDSRTPYLIVEKLNRAFTYDFVLDKIETQNSKDLLNFQIAYGLKFLSEKLNLSYRSFDPSEDVWIEGFDNPKNIKFDNSYFLKTQFRVVFVNLFKLTNNKRNQKLTNWEKDEFYLNKLYYSLIQQGMISKIPFPGYEIYNLGPCYTTEELKSRYYRNPSQIKLFVDYLILEADNELVNKTIERVIENEKKNFETLKTSYELENRLDVKTYFKNRIEDKIKIVNLFDKTYGKDYSKYFEYKFI